MSTRARLHICIMAGGKGERFWPLSRDSRPKQFLRIVGEKTMIAETASRNAALVPNDRLYVVTTKDQAKIVVRSLPELPKENIVAEPMGRNTAPCIGLMCALLARKEPEAVLAVVPADHVISDAKRYVRTLRDAMAVACREKALVTIGITPTFPETGYGYILAADSVAHDGPTKFSRVERFVEKPQRARAEELIGTGRAFWNAGMFVFRVADMLGAFRQFMPELHEGLAKIVAAKPSRLGATIKAVYQHAPSISIDYAVMEKAANVIVAHGAFRWDDVGSWSAVAEHWHRDHAGNVARGDVAAVEATGCVVVNDCPGAVGVVGLDNVVVVRTRDAVLVCPKDRAQDVKKIVQHMRNDHRLRKYTR